MSVTPEEAIEMIDDSLTVLSDSIRSCSDKQRKALFARADKLLDNRIKMMKERDQPEQGEP